MQNVDPRFGAEDGRALLPLRAVSRHVKRMADQLLTKERRCFKRHVHLGEALNGSTRLGFAPLVSTVALRPEQVDRLLAMITCTPPAGGKAQGLFTTHLLIFPLSSGFTEIGLKCDYRSAWCRQAMELLLKHTHLQPDCLLVRGVLCDERLFREFVASRPALQALIFEVNGRPSNPLILCSL